MSGERARYVLAVDLGTGGPKVALVSTDGEVAGFEFERTGLVLLDGGGAEQDPADWWRAITAAAGRLHGRDLAPPERIVAVAVTTQWFGTVAVDGGGRPLANALIWMDARGAEHARAVTGGAVRVSGYGARRLWRWLRLTGGVPSRTGKDPVGHILYLKHERPDVYRETRTFLEPMDHLNLRLTGRAAAAFDTITGHWVTDNRDLSRVRYDPALIRWTGIDPEKLPNLHPTGSVLGPITPEAARELGVPEGVPVVMGSGDTTSSGIGAGAVRDYEPHLYIGTSSWLTCHVPFKRTDVIHSITSLPSAIPGRYWVAAEQESAGICLTTLRDNVLFPDDGLSTGSAPDVLVEQMVALAERVPPGSDRLLFLPWLKGERTPVEDHRLRGGFFNQSLATTRAHLVRAVLEGVALNTRWMHRTVERFVKRRLDRIPFVGGGANSALWAQIHADVLDRTVRRMREPALANVRGAAFLAAVALGHLRLEDVPARVPEAEVHEPDPANRAVYDGLYEEFLRFWRANRKAFARLNPDH